MAHPTQLIQDIAAVGFADAVDSHGKIMRGGDDDVVDECATDQPMTGVAEKLARIDTFL